MKFNNSSILLRDIREEFFNYFKSKKFLIANPTGLSNPDIPVAYNPSAGFLEIRDYLHTDKKLPFKKFFVNEKCFRVVDSNIVGISERHLSFFEMSAFFFCGSNDTNIVQNEIEEELVRIIVDILVNVFQLDRQKIIVTLFGGGSIANLINIPSEIDMKDLWAKQGIPKENIVLTTGLRNFVINYQWGYAGSSYEIFYKINDNYIMEIGSTNKYKYKVIKFIHKGKQYYEIVPSKNFAYGSGFGLERLSCAINKKIDIFKIPELESCLNYLRSQISPNLHKLLILDEPHLKQIIDGIRSMIFIMSEGIKPTSSHSRGKILKDVIKNILEECNYLGIYENSFEIIQKISQILEMQYKNAYELKIDSTLDFLKEYISQIEISKKYSHLMQNNTS